MIVPSSRIALGTAHAVVPLQIHDEFTTGLANSLRRDDVGAQPQAHGGDPQPLCACPSTQRLFEEHLEGLVHSGQSLFAVSNSVETEATNGTNGAREERLV